MKKSEKESNHENSNDLVSSLSNLANYFGAAANDTDAAVHSKTTLNTKESVEMKYNPNVEALKEDERLVLRSKAIEEANAVLGTHEYVRDHYLENFNLLGVVTSPKLWDSHAFSNHPSTASGGGVSGEHPTKSTASTSSSVSESIFDTVNAMSESISKEIESLNTTLYAYSKTYLGGGVGDYYLNGSDTTSPVSGNIYDLETYLLGDSIHNTTFTTTSAKVMAILPQLENVDLTPVEAYLRKSGHLLEQFESYQDEQESKNDTTTTTHANHTNNHDRESDLYDPIQNVPEIFFSPNFDLTDSKTFESLLLFQNNNEHIESNSQRSTSLDISEWQIPKTTTLAQHLDNIELALLHQVRSKSDSFFRETNRFSYLKSLVADSVQEVISLRKELDFIRDKSVISTEHVPIMDRQRNDAHVLSCALEEILKVVQVKSSVGGLIAKGDYLGAVHAIQLGRKLLNGK